MFNLCSYTYIIYVYKFTDAAEKSESKFSRAWIPLDIMLMFLVALYYFIQLKLESYQNNTAVEVNVSQETSLNMSQIK